MLATAVAVIAGGTLFGLWLGGGLDRFERPGIEVGQQSIAESVPADPHQQQPDATAVPADPHQQQPDATAVPTDPHQQQPDATAVPDDRLPASTPAFGGLDVSRAVEWFEAYGLACVKATGPYSDINGLEGWWCEGASDDGDLRLSAWIDYWTIEPVQDQVFLFGGRAFPQEPDAGQEPGAGSDETAREFLRHIGSLPFDDAPSGEIAEWLDRHMNDDTCREASCGTSINTVGLTLTLGRGAARVLDIFATPGSEG